MRKTACEAILVEKPDHGKRADHPAAAEIEALRAEIEALRADNERKDAEIEALRADNERKDAEIEALRADNERKDAEIEALKRANAHDGGPHTPPLAQHPVWKGREGAQEAVRPRQKGGGHDREAPRRAKGPQGNHPEAKADRVQGARGEELPQVQERRDREDG